MNRVRAAWRISRAVLHLVVTTVIVVLRFPMLDVPGRLKVVAGFATKTFQVMGMRLVVEGQFRPGAKLLVANHVSWLDILAIHAVCPEARFVSKADVQHWPLVRQLAQASRTLFIERERARDALRVVHQMADALRNGDTVAVFPEGTTGDGRALLPFHANLLQAAIATGVPVQPVALRFSDAQHAISPAAEFLGETTLLQSFWKLACAEHFVVRVRVLQAQSCEHSDRRALAARLRTLIDEGQAG